MLKPKFIIKNFIIIMMLIFFTTKILRLYARIVNARILFEKLKYY